MNNLFDDDIFDDTNNESEKFSDNLHSLTSTNIEQNFNNWKNSHLICCEILGQDIYDEYLQEYLTTYNDLISYTINDVFDVTLHVPQYTKCKQSRLGIVDLSLFKAIPDITRIVIDSNWKFPLTTEIVFTNIFKTDIEIDANIISKIAYIKEVRDDNELQNPNFIPKKCLSFHNVIFDLYCLEKLKDIKDMQFNIVHDCNYKEEILYPGMEGKVSLVPVANYFNHVNKQESNINLFTHNMIKTDDYYYRIH